MWAGDMVPKEFDTPIAGGINIADATTKSYVDGINAVASMKQIDELNEKVEKLEKLVDKLITEFMPEHKI